MRAMITEIQRELTGLGDRSQSILSGSGAKAARREDYSGEPCSTALTDIAQAVLAACADVDPSTAKRLYFPFTQNISEMHAATMGIGTPGLSLDRNRQQAARGA